MVGTPIRGLGGSVAPRLRWAIPVAVLAGTAALPSVHHAPPGQQAMTAASCPASYADRSPWVPSKPTGSGAGTSLVPDSAPASAVVCGYGLGLTGSHRAIPLSGGRPLTGGLDRLAHDLHTLPPAPKGPWSCTTEAATNVNYLIGLRYPAAVVWVSSSQSPCRGTSNGSFVSGTEIASRVATAYAGGAWE